MARLRSAPSARQNTAANPSTRQALKEKTNTTSVKTQAYTEPQDFVKNARPTRGRAKKAAQDDDELYMAGGLGQKSDAPPSEAPMTTDDLAKSDGPTPPTARANKRALRQTRRPVQNEAQTKVFDDMKKRMRATAKEAAKDAIEDELPTSGNTGPPSDALPTKPRSARKSDTVVAERSEFSMSPSPPPSGRLSAVKNKRASVARPDSVLKSQSTPQAETSVLALKNFKRRPRQPSMLAMMQERAASARPSAAHVQATDDEAEDPSVFDLDGGDEDEEEFAPEAEGTPLHLRKAKRVSGLSARKLDSATKQKLEVLETAPSKKRKSDDLDGPSTSIGALRAKRQKSAAPDASTVNVDVTTHRPDSQGSPSRQETPQPQPTQEVQVIGSSPLPSSPSEALSTDDRERSPDAEVIVPSTEEQQEQQESTRKLPLNDSKNREEPNAANETMAEPASSSPLPDEPVATQGTDIMAEPLTQVTPPRPKRDREKKERKTKPMMTSTLQDLLPRRRQPLKPRHRKSEYDIDSESDEDTQRGGEVSDEDDGASNRRRRQTKAPAAKGRKSTAPAKKAPAARKSAAAPQSSRKSAADSGRRKTAATSKKVPAKKGKTYGRAGASDKENDPSNSDFEDLSDNDDSALPDTSITIHEAAQSGELAAQKAKFAEIDDWDMEFESVSFEEGRSSSQTWR